MMRTLTDFKRTVTVGTRLRTHKHWLPHFAGTVRTVTKVQTNGLWFSLPDEERRYWMPYPKAAHVRAMSPTVMRFEPTEGRFWELEVLPA